ncbi:ACT domain-containing protein [Luteimonas sp. RD2P54]|uniref:ACT domain-containing protein n=1 Tax=Luteimonas endophytica TaxID=3042023 RepID=A0ABT6J5E5_9GAMM|nr:ACT domain-containing protein [Luteimonas endophytica]MDH5821810.1 ACT domain-containing protein [Luteimonas endophytica]
MSGSTDLAAMLAGLRVHARPGEYVFATGVDPALAGACEASVREEEGLCCVLRREHADALGLAYAFVAAWLTLEVHSALDSVGLTAAVAETLAVHGIACNVLAGFYHDHLLVPAARRDDALAALTALAVERAR